MLILDCYSGRCEKPSCDGCFCRPVRSLRLLLKSRSMGGFDEEPAATPEPSPLKASVPEPQAPAVAPVCPPKPEKAPSAAPAKRRKRLTAPRQEIAWYPTIKPELCNGCGDCKVLCKPGVFGLGEPDPTGIHRPKLVVANPYNCLVLCTRCVPICTSGAITLPDKADFEKYVEYLD